MAHHKRRRPKHQRAGCIICKPHKDERGKGKPDRQKPTVRRRLQEKLMPTPSKPGPVPAFVRKADAWHKKVVDAMSDQEVSFWLKRLRSGDI